MERAKYYQNLFDASTGFMRAKDSQGKFIEPFDPLLSEHGFEGQYIEGTAWQHSFFVPHDVEGLSALYGGKKVLANKLDSLFKSVVKLTVVELILSFNFVSSSLALATSEVILEVLPFTFSVRILILFVLSPVLLILLVNSAVIELIADFAAVESGFSKSLV